MVFLHQSTVCHPIPGSDGLVLGPQTRTRANMEDRPYARRLCCSPHLHSLHNCPTSGVDHGRPGASVVFVAHHRSHRSWHPGLDRFSFPLGLAHM